MTEETDRFLALLAAVERGNLFLLPKLRRIVKASASVSQLLMDSPEISARWAFVDDHPHGWAQYEGM